LETVLGELLCAGSDPLVELPVGELDAVVAYAGLRSAIRIVPGQVSESHDILLDVMGPV
jgi:hypothetical protein